MVTSLLGRNHSADLISSRQFKLPQAAKQYGLWTPIASTSCQNSERKPEVLRNLSFKMRLAFGFGAIADNNSVPAAVQLPHLFQRELFVVDETSAVFDKMTA
jgi:hypothetical protein